MGNNVTTMDLVSCEGPSLSFALNVFYLIQALEAFDCKTVTLDLGESAARPVTMWGDKGIAKYKHVMMPIHIRK